MSNILISLIAAGFALGLNVARAENTSSTTSSGALECDNLSGQDKALCEKHSNFVKKTDQTPDGAEAVHSVEPTMTPAHPADPTDSLKNRDSRKQEGNASSALPEPQTQKQN